MFDKYYKILNLNNNASEEEIKKSYKKLAIQYHPDKNPNNKEESEKKFKEISEAYEILTNKEKYINKINCGQNNPAFSREINPNKIFEEIFSQMNMNFGNMNFSNMNMGQEIHISNNPRNFMSRSSTRFENGKRIITITEEINGVKSVKTIISG
tara:strand:- start:897 stop:1358 length:462 start_codon:yes stop_codon:yes gene_type:complete